MSHEELTSAIETLHREVGETTDLDQEDREHLREMVREIQAVLDESDSSTSLGTRVADSARRFEESHPVLTQTLGRIADTLQQMGI